MLDAIVAPNNLLKYAQKPPTLLLKQFSMIRRNTFLSKDIYIVLTNLGAERTFPVV